MAIQNNFSVKEGILDHQINQLIEYSHTDPQIKQFTSDLIRFKNTITFNQWLVKGRTIYCLVDQNNNLLGIIWFGQKEPPINIKANYTFAIRIYSIARGQGLSQFFMKSAFKRFLKLKHIPKIIGFWLETSINNFAAIHTYEKFGFKRISNIDNKIIMHFKN